MSVPSIEAFLFDQVPRHANAEDDPAKIVGELVLFWEFMYREYEWPEAKEIVDWLKRKDRVARFAEKLRDPAKFDASKGNVVTSANAEAKFEKGRGRFRALSAKDLAQSRKSNSTTIVSSPSAGRNEACPCGSGKKFKKCCGPKGNRR